MFNRHTYERHVLSQSAELQKEEDYRKLMDRRKRQRNQQTEHYKERVRDFLVKMASHPLELGQYIPPVKDIMRENHQELNLANAQLYINGFKTNRERLDRAISDNQILDYAPTPVPALNHQFRSRIFDKQIQPGMRFQGQNSPKADSKQSPQSSRLSGNRSSVKLPSIANPQIKMHFKGVEQLGNKLKSMEQKASDRIGLVNKLQTVYGGAEINLEKTSLQVLTQCKLNKSKTVKSIHVATLTTEQSSKRL